MALIKCPECQGQVSDKAAACPHCGYAGERAAGRSFTVDENHAKASYRAQKKQIQKKRLGFVAAFFVAIMVMGFFAETNEDGAPRVADSDSQPGGNGSEKSSILASVVNNNAATVEPRNAPVSDDQEEVEVSSESIPMSFEECQAAKGSVIAKLNVPPQNVVPVINTSLVTITRMFADDGSVLITCSSADNKMVITQSSVTR